MQKYRKYQRTCMYTMK